jgi:hypothetical protein
MPASIAGVTRTGLMPGTRPSSFGFGVMKYPRHLCGELELHELQPRERRRNKLHTRRETYREPRCCRLKIEGPEIVPDRPSAVGSRDENPDEVEPAPIGMEAWSKSRVVIHLGFPFAVDAQTVKMASIGCPYTCVRAAAKLRQ